MRALPFTLVLFSSLVFALSVGAQPRPPSGLVETSPDAMVMPYRRSDDVDLTLTWGRNRDGQRVMCADTPDDRRSCYRPGLTPRFVGGLELLSGLVITAGGVTMFALGLHDVLRVCRPGDYDCSNSRFSETGQTVMMGVGAVTAIGGIFVMRAGVIVRSRYRAGLLYIRERHRTMMLTPVIGDQRAGLVLGGAF